MSERAFGTDLWVCKRGDRMKEIERGQESVCVCKREDMRHEAFVCNV